MTAEIVSLLEVRQRRLKRLAIAILEEAGLPAFAHEGGVIDPNEALFEVHACDSCPCEMNPDNLA